MVDELVFPRLQTTLAQPQHIARSKHANPPPFVSPHSITAAIQAAATPTKAQLASRDVYGLTTAEAARAGDRVEQGRWLGSTISRLDDPQRRHAGGLELLLQGYDF